MTTPPGPEVQPELGDSRFRIWHFAVLFLSGAIGGIVGYTIGIGITGDDVDQVGWFTTLCGFAGQFSVLAIGLLVVSRRRGTGSWATDYGFALRPGDGWALFLGLGLQVGLGILMSPLLELAGDEKQGVLQDLLDSSGTARVVLVVTALLLAPVLEELVFRGLLLRALLARVPPTAAIVISALIFGLVHPLLNPTVGTLVVTPGLVAFGAVAATLAVRSQGDLSKSILLHMGFNLLGIVLVLA